MRLVNFLILKITLRKKPTETIQLVPTWVWGQLGCGQKNPPQKGLQLPPLSSASCFSVVWDLCAKKPKKEKPLFLNTWRLNPALPLNK